MEIKVSSQSNPNSVAGAIANLIKDNKEITILTIGAGAVNQAVKAVIISNGYLAPLGKRAKIEPFFYETEVDDKYISAIKLKLIVEE